MSSKSLDGRSSGDLESDHLLLSPLHSQRHAQRDDALYRDALHEASSSSNSLTPPSSRSDARLGHSVGNFAALDLDSNRSGRRKHSWSARGLFLDLHHWIQGPPVRRSCEIQPLLPNLQLAPLNLLERYVTSRMQKFWLLLISHFSIIIIFLGILTHSVQGCLLSGYDRPIRMSCNSRFW